MGKSHKVDVKDIPLEESFAIIAADVAETTYKQNPLKSLDAYKSECKEKMAHGWKDYCTRIEHGMKILVNNARGLAHLNSKKLHQFIEQNHSQQIKEGMIMQKELQISDGDMTHCYEIGQQLFARHNFKDAADVFLVLSALNPTVASFWKALGLCEEQNKSYDTAVMAYAIALLYNENDPFPIINSALCLKHIKEIDKARELLHNAIQQYQNKPEFTAFTNQAQKLESTL